MRASVVLASTSLVVLGHAATATKGFTIDQVDSGKLVPKSGTLALENAYRKYGKSPPTVVNFASPAEQSGSVTAIPQQYDASYLSPVQIGTPAQTLMLDFDTGSSDLWFFSNLMPNAERKGHTFFRTKQSTSAQLQANESWAIRYGDKSGASGVVYTDKVVIGGATATAQAVEAATSVSASFTNNTANDGLVGLAYSILNQVRPQPAKTFFDNIAPTLPQKLFAATLKRSGPGSYDFGFIDTSKYTGALTYTPIKSTGNLQGFYGIAVNGYSVGSTAFNTTFNSIVDTGTSLILLAAATVTNYYAQVPKSQYNSQVVGYIFPCSTTLPSLTLNIGGAKRVVPGTDLNFAEVGTISGVDYCYGGLQRNTGLGIQILGDAYLKGVYAVFDVGNSRIGFATQA